MQIVSALHKIAKQLGLPLFVEYQQDISDLILGDFVRDSTQLVKTIFGEMKRKDMTSNKNPITIGLTALERVLQMQFPLIDCHSL